MTAASYRWRRIPVVIRRSVHARSTGPQSPSVPVRTTGRVAIMQTADRDVLDLLDHAWERLWNRMAGLTDREWSWRPDDADDKITIRWRLFRIAEAQDS